MQEDAAVFRTSETLASGVGACGGGREDGGHPGLGPGMN
jgi:hypothetical protein